MLINCVIIIFWLIRHLTPIQICIRWHLVERSGSIPLYAHLIGEHKSKSIPQKSWTSQFQKNPPNPRALLLHMPYIRLLSISCCRPSLACSRPKLHLPPPELGLSPTLSSPCHWLKLHLLPPPRPPSWPWRRPPWAPRLWCPPRPWLLYGLHVGSSPPPRLEFSDGGWRHNCLSWHRITMPRSKVKTRPSFYILVIICFTSCLATLLFLILWTACREFQLRVYCCFVLHRRGSAMAAQGEPTSLEKEHACLFTLIPLFIIFYLVCCSCWDLCAPSPGRMFGMSEEMK
jgi:hypothetical protein